MFLAFCFLMDVSCEWAKGVDHNRPQFSTRKPFLCFLFVCLFCSMREILWLGCFTATQTWSIKGLFYFQTTMYPSTIFCWNWQYLKPPEMIWEAVDRHNMCVWKGLSHNTSIYPFSEALSSLWSTCLTCFAHNSFIIFVSSVAMVGVDFCLVCLIDKSILKLFFCCCFFFCLHHLKIFEKNKQDNWCGSQYDDY